MKWKPQTSTRNVWDPFQLRLVIFSQLWSANSYVRHIVLLTLEINFVPKATHYLLCLIFKTYEKSNLLPSNWWKNPKSENVSDMENHKPTLGMFEAHFLVSGYLRWLKMTSRGRNGPQTVVVLVAGSHIENISTFCFFFLELEDDS